MHVLIKRYLVLTVLLVVCVVIYGTRPATLPQDNTSDDIVLMNAFALKDWAPDAVYASALQHISYYLASSATPGKLVTITDTPHYGDDGSLSFEFKTNDTATINAITIETQDYGGGLLSTAVTINGEPSTYTASTRLYDASFTGFSELLDKGLTGLQVYEIQKALARFDERASFRINAGTISQTANAEITVTLFDLLVNNKTYKLSTNSSGITDVHVTLHDSAGERRFDSGEIRLAN